MDILKNLFPDIDQSLIQSIPLSNPETDDKLLWGEDQHGAYFVNSGYHLLKQDQHMDTNPDNIDWKLL